MSAIDDIRGKFTAGRAAPSARYQFQQIIPPGARGKFQPQLMTADYWYAEEKLDGDRRIAQFCHDATRFTGRVISKVDGLMVEKTANLPHLNIAVPELEGTVLDGEMICDWPGSRSRDVTSIMGSKPEEAIRKQRERGFVTYVVFDCLFYKGVDIRKKIQAERRMIAEEVIKAWSAAVSQAPGKLHARIVDAVFENRQLFLDLIWERNGEGIILKKMDALYGDEKAWVKVKREVTHDVVIMGFDPPKDISVKSSGEVSATKYAAEGLIGAIRFGQYKEVSLDEFHKTRLSECWCDGIVKGDKRYILTYCGSTSGFDDDVRRAISKDPTSFIGTVMEITAQLREESGKFRHPRFGQFRNNKNSEDCLWGQT